MAIPSSPYYSVEPTDPDVYHDYEDCPNGQQILPQNRRPGTNNWPRLRKLPENGQVTR